LIGCRGDKSWGLITCRAISANFTVPLGGTFKVFTFVFTTSKVGELKLTGLGVGKTVTVLPLEP
jgi:hypothetical protein